MKPFPLLLGALCALIVSCSSTKIPDAQITFHTQTPPGEMKSMVFAYTHKGKVINMRRMPSFSISDVETYKPFVAKDGSFGAILNLDRTAIGRLYNHTTQNKGAYMISVVNGNISIPLKIDRPIRDGKLIVWDSLTQQDVYLLDMSIQREGDDADKAKARAKNAKKILKEQFANAKEKE